jgi:hypothetical protein
MGKKSRLKAERRVGAPAPASPRVVLAKARKQAEDAMIMSIYNDLQHAIAHERKLKLNDELFSHPDNVHKLELTFGPMERWLDEQVRTGESEALPNGTLVFRPSPDDEYYPVGDSFMSVADSYELIAADQGIPDQGDGLRKLAARVNAGMPLDLPAIQAAKKSLAWMRSVTMSLSPRTFHQYPNTVCTRYELQRLGIVAK